MATLTIGRRTITFVTSNKKKLEEVTAILGSSCPFVLNSMKLDLPELQGEPEVVAIEKCRFAQKFVDGPVITEDTSLCFNALNGLPGVYIKHFLDKTGHNGLNNLLAAYDDKSAYAQCIFSLSEGPGAEPRVFVGRTAVSCPAIGTRGRQQGLQQKIRHGAVKPAHTNNMRLDTHFSVRAGYDCARERTERLWLGPLL